MLEDPKGGPARRLSAGDILLLSHGRAHMLHDGSGAPPAPAHPHASLNLTIDRNNGRGASLEMLCGRFLLPPPQDRLVSESLPEDLVIHSGGHHTAAGRQLATLIALIRTEAANESLGGHAMLNALSAAMFALALRVASEQNAVSAGLLSAVSQPRLGPALSALFQEPERAWTMPKLARLCHMSRATFARHFQQQMGRSASSLLLDIRMALAADRLRKTSASISEIAEAAGYQSDAAFQRAFKQHMDMTPARWRRSQQSPA